MTSQFTRKIKVFVAENDCNRNSLFKLRTIKESQDKKSLEKRKVLALKSIKFTRFILVESCLSLLLSFWALPSVLQIIKRQRGGTHLDIA